MRTVPCLPSILMGLLLVALGGSSATWLDASGSGPTHAYLGNNPHGSDNPDWSENAQGLANDGHYWYFTNKTALFKYEADWASVDGDDVGKLGSVTFPPELAAIGIHVDHFGDPDHYGGYIFVPFEGKNTIIAAYRASDLSFVDWVDVSGWQTRTGWVAIDPVERILYTSTDRLVAGTPILRYALDVSRVDNCVQGDFLTSVAAMAVLEGDGSPIAGQFLYMQGGVFTPTGDLYLSAGKTEDSPEDTRGGLHVFRRSADGTAFLLVESSVNGGGSGFAYEYDPSGAFGSGEEPEGLDWWNRDNVPGSPYAGQLHAILLDNDAGDDKIWLKHYRVIYAFLTGTDTDGDGLVDRDEIYEHNTDPRLRDTDGDGQFDGDELASGTDPIDLPSPVGDCKPPVLQCGDPDAAWHADDVSVACTASDSGSGLASPADAFFSLATHVDPGVETSNASTDSRQVCDRAGNCATAGPVGGNKVDKKAPDVAIVTPAGGDVYLLNAAVVSEYDCSDGGSGVASCSGPVPSGTNVPTGAPGAATFTVNAMDQVGNVASSTASYVVTFATCLLYDPLVAKKSGSTYPIKLQLCDANRSNVSSPSIVVHAVSVTRTSTSVPGPLDDSGHANPDFDFRYDASLGGYVFNLRTTGLTTGTYHLNFIAGADPLVHPAPFAVK